MDLISKNVEVKIPQERAFLTFINDLAKWWPKEYTWSQNTLVDMKIDTKVNGLCTEIGPNDFRCDWGTVTEIEIPAYLAFKWQISIQRSPIPNPDKASTVKITFEAISGFETNVRLKHTDFKNHGGDYQEYLQAMESDKGWIYILNSFKDYCEK